MDEAFQSTGYVPSANETSPPLRGPGFINLPALRPMVLKLHLVLMAATALVVGGRVFATASRSSHRLRADDWCCVLATTAAFASSGLWLAVADYRHRHWDLSFNWIHGDLFKVILAAHLLVFVAILLAKVSILLLLRRLLAGTRPYMRRCTTVGIVAAATLYLPTLVLTPAFCVPRPDEPWEAAMLGRCGRLGPWLLAFSVGVIALDAFIFVLPLPTVLGLRTSPRRKAGLSLVFGTACLGIGAACYSLYSRLALWSSLDIAWSWIIPMLCASGETYIAIIVGSAPGFASFIKQSILTNNSKPRGESRRNGTPDLAWRDSRQTVFSTCSSAQTVVDVEARLAVPAMAVLSKDKLLSRR